jgi:hypothetical protein
MFRLRAKKNGKAHKMQTEIPKNEDDVLADSAIRLALEACDSNLALTRTAKGAARKVRAVLDDLVAGAAVPLKK